MIKSEITDALSSGNRIIGYLTWYDCRNTSISPVNLKALFNKHGLDDSYFPEDIKPKAAFQRACRKAITHTGTASDNRRSVVKLIVDGMNKIVYGVVDLDVNLGTEAIDPDFNDRVWLDKDNLSVSYDHGHPTSKEISKIYTQLCGEYDTRCISRMIVKSVERMCSVSLRDAGVIYFVPTAFDKDLHALQNVVNEVGQCNMRVYAIGDNNGNVSNIGNAAKSQINDRIKQMKDEIADLKSSIDSGTLKGKNIANSVEVRIRRFKELKDKCGILADALKMKAESLEGDLDEVAALIKNELIEFAA